ncbi:unannotated protein [freshwater metagenome]|uniref:Unannotated protein n=1 Tax=freshwater metagenome TaxID=449393 RepID=A0A6J6XYR1_9ZZZZ
MLPSANIRPERTATVQLRPAASELTDVASPALGAEPSAAGRNNGAITNGPNVRTVESGARVGSHVAVGSASTTATDSDPPATTLVDEVSMMVGDATGSLEEQPAITTAKQTSATS